MYEYIKDRLSLLKESINTLMPKYFKSMKGCPLNYKINNGICELNYDVKKKESEILLEDQEVFGIKPQYE